MRHGGAALAGAALPPHRPLAPRAPLRRATRVASAPARAALDGPWKGWPALKQHIEDAGGWVHPALSVRDTLADGRAVFVTADVPRGPLAFVPRGVCITSGDAARSPTGRSLWGDEEAPLAHLRLTPEEQLAAYLLVRVTKDSISPPPEHPYHASLPPRDAFQAPLVLDVFPLFWTAKQLAALEEPGLAGVAAAQRARAEEVYSPLAKAFQDVDAVPHPPTPRLGDWLWALVCVRSRTYAPPAAAGEPPGLSLEPLVDCVNHAPFAAAPGGRSRNTLHSYVPAGTPAGALPALSAAAGEQGCACLAALRPLRKGEQLLVSYRDATPGGALSAADCLARYGFLPHDTREAPHAVSDAAAAAAREQLAAAVDAAAQAGAPREALLQAALAAWGRDVAAAAAKEAKTADDAPNRPAALAAHFRMGRTLARARAALDKLPREERRGEGLRRGVEAGAKAARAGAGVREAIYSALISDEPRLLTPQEALAAF